MAGCVVEGADVLELFNVSGRFCIDQLATVGNVFLFFAKHRRCRKCRDSSTYNKELAVDVLIDSPPAAGAEGFVENIERVNWGAVI